MTLMSNKAMNSCSQATLLKILHRFALSIRPLQSERVIFLQYVIGSIKYIIERTVLPTYFLDHHGHNTTQISQASLLLALLKAGLSNFWAARGCMNHRLGGGGGRRCHPLTQAVHHAGSPPDSHKCE